MKGTKYGIAAGAGMFLFYFLILFFANSLEHAVQQTMENLPFIIALVIGFGVQVALFFHVRLFSNGLAKNKEVMASGGMSIGSMAACCAHHLTDLGIVIGISGLIALLAKFQTALFVLAIASNVYGIARMLTVVKNFKLYTKGGKLEAIAVALPLEAKGFVLATSIVIVPVFFLAPFLMPSPLMQQSIAPMEKQTVTVGDVEISASPAMQGSNLVVEISLNTHTGNPSIDFTHDAFALDSSGKKHYGSWSGATPEQGHHINGKLTFTEFTRELATLEINNVKGQTAVLKWKTG